MNQELQDKINRLKELIPLATQEPWNLIQKYDEWENYVGPESWADMGQNICVCKYSRDADYIFAANPQTISEIIAELESALQKQSAQSYACCECQEVEAELRYKIEKLDAECDYLARRLALMSADGPLAKVVEHWRNAARNTI